MTRAVTAEAELKQLKGESAKELQATKEELVDSLEQAQATAEQRLEQHTEGYRLQVLCCATMVAEGKAHSGVSMWAQLGHEPLLQPCSVCQCAHACAAPLRTDNVKQAQS